MMDGEAVAPWVVAPMSAAQGIALGVGVVLAYILARSVAAWSIGLGERRGVVSQVSERSSHTRPTSRLGGLGLLAGIAIPMALCLIVRHSTAPPGEALDAELAMMLGVAGSALIFFAIGLADDLRDLTPTIKLGGQALALAPLLAARAWVIAGAPEADASSFAAIDWLLIPLWILFFVNATNFMDGMDGFASGFALVVGVSLAATGFGCGLLQREFPQVAPGYYLAPIVAAASAGFFAVNRPPARVFMGDGGSHLIGFLLAAHVFIARSAPTFGLAHTESGRPLLYPLAVVIMLTPFIFDVLLTLIRRATRGENLLAAHRSHLYQRLMICGLSHRDVLNINLVAFAICGILGFFHTQIPGKLWPVLAVATMLCYWRYVIVKETEARTGRPPPGY